MYDFFLQLFFISSLAVIVYLMARALPRVQEEEGYTTTALEYLEGWVKKLPLSKIDRSLNTRFEKTLRKIRVVVLRLDNVIHNHLSNRRNGENSAGGDLFDQLRK